MSLQQDPNTLFSFAAHDEQVEIANVAQQFSLAYNMIPTSMRLSGKDLQGNISPLRNWLDQYTLIKQ